MTIDTIYRKISTFSPSPVEAVHWQLRHLVATDPTTSYLYTVSGRSSRIICFTNHDNHYEVFEAESRPTCLDVHHGVVVVGNERGNVQIYNEHMQSVNRLSLANSIINSVRLYVDNSHQMSLCVSTNDDDIILVNVATLQTTRNMSFSCPPNYAEISSDGCVVSVFDDGTARLLTPNTHESWDSIFSNREFADAGFSSAWKPGNMAFGCCSQDGVGKLFDRRNFKCLFEFTSHPEHLPFRSMAFSSSGDMLFTTEQNNNLHIIDSNYHHSIVNLNNEEDEISISGAAFVKNSYIMVGTDSGIFSIALNVPYRLRSPDFCCL
ncbi:hypothetical protein P9112_006510 [Eukaryota sp. TZLM1-RC]